MSNNNNNDTGRKVALGAAIAGAVGYVAGILTAPKSGKETREDVKNAASKAKAEAEKQLKNLHGDLTEQLDKAKKVALSAKDSASKELNNAVEQAATAKNRVREKLSSIHEGGSDDNDLQRAIDEASSAVSHLKKFLKTSGDKK